ncbi:MAG: SRPBCC domain-containing protein, partial [Caldilineaceae bacterium]|nr:SRPBCC domain-containing protein [Caldilineaceae bacterium]
MSRATQKMERPSDRELVVTRTFAAPRALVWQAWTQCEHLQEWWAPAGWSVPVCKMDFRVGGTWHYCMKGPMPDGSVMESWGLTVYQEIVEPERIVALDQFADAEGNVAAEMPKMLNTITFTEIDGQTAVTSHNEFAAVEDLETIIQMGMEEGMTQSWDQLEAHLAQLQ